MLITIQILTTISASGAVTRSFNLYVATLLTGVTVPAV
jgi:hypothetical protein